MGIPRPQRRPVGKLDEIRRRAILTEAKSLYVSPKRGIALDADRICGEYCRREFYADLRSMLEEVAERYGRPRTALTTGLTALVRGLVDRGLYADDFSSLNVSYETYDDKVARALREHGHELSLLVLPDEEFLTAIEHTGDWAREATETGGQSATALLHYTDRVCRAHAAPFELDESGKRFRWVGDRQIWTTSIAPTLQALDDSRLEVAREEFNDALVKRRAGKSEDLRDAVHEAGNAVEAVMSALLVAHGRATPRQRTASALFNRLVEPPAHVPGALSKLAGAAGDIRNAAGGHTQGAAPSPGQPEMADAAIRAAAATITALAHYLPAARSAPTVGS